MARNRAMVWLVFLTFFIISLITNILNAIVPDIISSFRVSLAAAGLLIFAFFIAYGVMSIPAGFLVERFREKRVMIAAFAASTAGSLSFAVFPAYRVAIVSLFVIGVGMTLLQVAINPLLRVAGGEEHYAFNSTLAQVVFGAASAISPRIYSYLVANLKESDAEQNALLRLLGKATPAGLSWASMYWIFAACSLLMVLVLAAAKFPRVQHTEEERAGSLEMYRSLAKKPIVWMYFAAMFAYTGSEQGTANWISSFLEKYHGYDPHTTGAAAVSWFWGLLTAGCVAGLLLLKIFDSRKVLIGGAAGALACLTAGLFGPAKISLLALPGIGLFASVLWPIVVSLALNSVAEYHGSFSGILNTGIIGAAVVPVVIGRIGDLGGLRTGMAFLYVTFGMVLSTGFWARPLIHNATIGNAATRKGEKA
jgi:fucose permease